MQPHCRSRTTLSFILLLLSHGRWRGPYQHVEDGALFVEASSSASLSSTHQPRKRHHLRGHAVRVSAFVSSNTPVRQHHNDQLHQRQCEHMNSYLVHRTRTRDKHHNICKTPTSRLFTAPSILPITSYAANNIAAGITLLLPTLFGIVFEKFISKSGGGQVITLLSAALLSNISSIVSWIPKLPTEHVLYDWCWSVFLPASLVFALLSSSSKATESDEFSIDDRANTTKQCLQGMALPFFIGSIGSIVGCIASFSLIKFPMTPTLTTSPQVASAILAGCLCASYIGGTVNFFAAAKILTPLLGDGGESMGSLFGSMAAADLVVMAFYFAILSTTSKSAWLHCLFPSRDVVATTTECTGATNESEELIASSFSATLIAITIALSSVSVATRFEQMVMKHFNLPGTMCAFLAVLGLFYEISIGAILCTMQPNRQSKTLSHLLYNSLSRISGIAPTLSNLCFYLLFAAVGTTADISSAVSGGPMALAFASLTLFVHSMIVLGGTFIGNCIGVLLARQGKWVQSSWEEVLTASNAAIGGPSTAAAFAAGLVPHDKGVYRRSLIIGATIYGVIGYATGTTIGALLAKSLLRL